MMQSWMRIARSRRVVHRAVAYAVVVGAILVAINHGDSILAGDMSDGHSFRIGLTVLVPYFVSTSSSVGALLQSEG